MKRKHKYPKRISHFDAHKEKVEKLYSSGKNIKEIHAEISKEMPIELSYVAFWKWFKKANL